MMELGNGNSNSPFDCILFDLDDTLYPSEAGIAQFTRQNIEEFLTKRCGISPEKAFSLRLELFRSYGSSLAGLRALGYDVTPDEYHSYVHARLPYESIQPNPQLRDLLRSIPQKKIMFTNSDREHAKKVMERLGIDGSCFHTIICFETLNPYFAASGATVLKPSRSAVQAAIRIAGSDPRLTLFLDDSERNITAGKALGLRTALVGKRVKSKEADYLVGNISNLRQAIPEIWSAEEMENTTTREEEQGKACGGGGGQDKKMLSGSDMESILALSAPTTSVEARCTTCVNPCILIN